MKLLAKIRNSSRRGGLGPLIRGQRGFTLIEILVAVAILGVIAVAFLSALSTGYLSLVLADKNTMAESLTRTEFENIRNAPYPIVLPDSDEGITGNYPDHRSLFGGLYDVYISVELDDPDHNRPIQVITVQVYHQGEIVLITETYKVDPNRSYL